MNNKVIVEKWAVKGGGLVGWLMPRRLDNGLFCYTYLFNNSFITLLMIIYVFNFDNSEVALFLTHLFQTPTIQFVYTFSTIFYKFLNIYSYCFLFIISAFLKLISHRDQIILSMV